MFPNFEKTKAMERIEDDGPTDEAGLAPRVSPRLHRTSRLWPLAALAITTASLASSAIRVVASSIVEVHTGPAKPSAPIPRLAWPGPDLTVGLREVCDLECDDDIPPPAPRPPTTATPPPPRPSVVRSPGSQKPIQTSARPDRTPTPLPSVSVGKKKQTSPDTPVPPSPRPSPGPPPARPEAKRIMVRDAGGQTMVARIHGQDGDRVAVMLPDGRIGWPEGLVYTDQPFVARTPREVQQDLLRGEYHGFKSLATKHYVVLYQCSDAYAQASANWLDDLYAKLVAVLNKRGVPVHEAEFPLVAVIFKSEDDFRRYKKVAPDIQAYYEILSNRVFLYETSRRDQSAPEVSALRKPQTVAHEGTHQILQNIGVQPRLSDWPLWLVEGLAEYCASPKFAKNGQPTWAGLGQVNLQHIATLRDLDDPLSTRVPGAHVPTIGREPGTPLVEYLVTRSELTPTDYALSWALTYYLAIKRSEDFLDFVREMSQLPPLVKRSPADHLASFKSAFGDNLVKVDAAVLASTRKVMTSVDALPYYAVMFEQQMNAGSLRRAAMVSQSPTIIQQWIESTTSPRGGDPRWQILPHPSRARALITAEQWMGSH